MKKNISINICGTIYAIDEDAYQLLENYLQSMKNYFRNEEGGDEIADDIEHRVAELLWEYKEKGMTAVNIETIKEIINKVGNPADIDGEASSHSETSDGSYDHSEHSENFFSSFGDETSIFGKIRKNISTRRFYRNADNKMLGGICSGLADYFGVGDVTIWRLAILVLAFVGWGFNMSFFHHIFPFNIINFTFNFLVPLTYFVIWIVVPEARTAEDKLRMQGMDVNPENIREQVVSDSEGKKTERVTTENKASGCLKTLLICFALLLMLPLLIAFIAVLIAIFVACLFVFGGVSVVAGIFPEIVNLAEPITACGPALWVGLIAALLAVGIPINAFIRLFKSNTKPLSPYKVTGILFIWLLSIAVIVGSVVSGAMNIEKFKTEIREKGGLRHGIQLYSSYEWDAIDELGWDLTKLENVFLQAQRRTGYGNLPHKALKLTRNRSNSNASMSFMLLRTEHFDEGDYVLESLIDVEGKGGVIKAVDEGKDVAFNDLSDEGQKLWTMDWTEGSKLPIFENPDSAGWDGFAKDGREHWTYRVSKRQREGTLRRRDGREHWTYRVSKPFHHKAGDITISVSADKAYLNKFNIRHIQLRKVK